MSTIGYIGVGKLGVPCAEEIVKKGHTVNGYDISEIVSDLINQKDTIEETVKGADIVFVAVPTPHDPAYDGKRPTSHLEPKDFNYDIVNKVLEEANKYMNKNQLLVLISTVLPGTTRREFVQRVTNTRFVYNPYLIAMGTVGWDMINPEMIMIGTDDGSETGDAKQLRDFYDTIMENNPRYVIGTYDECECIKVFYNTFISTKLSLVNMIQDVAERQGNINVDVVTKALAESTMRIMSDRYMTAGMGDGGSCHPRDNIALRFMAKELNLDYDIFDSIMTAREVQAKNLAKFVVKTKEKYGGSILLNGVSYKPGVSYTDGSYALLVDYYIREMGESAIYIDPLVSEIPSSAYSPTGVILLCHPEPYVNYGTDSVFIDPWRQMKPNSNYMVIHYGNTRKK
jgi:UDPglucose 6-dehydrogenase